MHINAMTQRSRAAMIEYTTNVGIYCCLILDSD